MGAKKASTAGKPILTAEKRPSAAKRSSDKTKAAKAPVRKPANPRRSADDSSGRNGRRRRPRWLRLTLLGAAAFLWLPIVAIGLTIWYGRDLPAIGRLAEDSRRPSITLAANDGSIIASYGDLYGEPLRVGEMSPYLPQAVIAIEDRRYRSHFGLDLIGIARAMLVNLRVGAWVQGGSTLTQQLAKNLFLTPERSFKRKIQEAILAIQLEARYSKDQILTLYMNRVYLGAGTYGVDAAARRFFGKSARDVTLYEAAVLAGLLKAPSMLNPARDGDRADRRAKLVLNSMVETGFVTPLEAEAAYTGKTEAKPPGYRRGRYFGDWALSQAQQSLGSVRRDLLVQTTLDPRIQAIAEQAVAEVLAAQGAAVGAGEAAVVAMRPDGAVLAMVGGKSYRTNQFNRATQALRQPGSAFKLFVYLAGLESGLTPDSRMIDRRVKVGDWTPENYGGRYRGEVSLREAFARSLNSVAVQIVQKTGLERVLGTARRLGITSSLPGNLTVSLGAAEVTLLELTGAFAVFANRGHDVWPYGLSAIEGTKGTTLYRRPEGRYRRAVSPSHVNRMTDLLRAVVAWGTGKRADPGRPAAGKTGTSQDFRDAWFVGFTADLVVGVWTGNDDGTPMHNVTGGRLPAEIWRRVVTAALDGQPAKPLPGGGRPVASDPKPPVTPAQQQPADLIGSLIGGLEADRDSAVPLPRMADPNAGAR
ncbi:MAG: PBP1A family penicillin-binding protein [Rhodospirillales bacterium]|nr:PBP1A family penicillin-binding protein [Rhodospirillales bacterium]